MVEMQSSDESCDLVSSPARARWTVYGLADPRNGWVFYVGVSRDVRKRLRLHISDKNSAVNEICCHLRDRGLMPFIVEFGWHWKREHALKQEGAIITVLPLTFNKTHEAEGEAFWRWFRPDHGEVCSMYPSGGVDYEGG